MSALFRRENLILFAILLFAVAVRIAGVGYGLPLWLIDDEPAFTLAALKMIQLKTLFPAAHFEEFKSVLYYPPYLSYFYLPFFIVYLAVQFLFFDGTREQFMNYLGSDLSGFFIIVRVLHAFLAAASVWLVYRVGKTIFRETRAGLAAAFLLATSILHISLSPNGRHWPPVAFIMALGFFILTRESWSYKKRYFWSALLAGLGMGVSVMAGFLGLFMVMHYLFVERRGVAALLRDWFSYAILAMFGFLAWLPKWLYPGSYGFGVDVTSGDPKTLMGALAAPFLFLKPILVSEPVLALLLIIGLIFSFRSARSWFWASGLFIVAYSLAFYQFFRFEHRFVLGLYPLLAVIAGYGLVCLWQSVGVLRLRSAGLVAIGIIIIFQVTAASRLGYLMYRGDSRSLAREWAEENLPAGSKVVVNARLTRLATNASASQEQATLDPTSLRQADRTEAAFAENPHGYKSFHALNLFTVRNEEFYNNVERYMEDNKYEYLVLSLTDFQKDSALFDRLKQFAANQELLVRFGQDESLFSHTIGQLRGNPLALFRISEFGPPIGVYKLR